MGILRGLAKFQAMRQVLGLDEDPLRDVKSIQSIRSSQQARGLAERKFAYERSQDKQKEYFDRTKFVFTQLASVYSQTPEGDPRREYLRQMTENFKFSLPQEMQLALGATELLRSISPEERRRTEWRKANPRPKATVGADGQPLAWNEENADIIAGDKLRASKWDYFDKTVAFGTETGKVISPPRSWLSPPVGEGAEGRPGPRRFYFNHEDTGQLMSMELGAEGLSVGLEQAKKWNWSPQRMAMNDFQPTGPPMVVMDGGVKTQRTPGKSLASEKLKWNDEIYGTPDEAVKAIPKPWKDALGEMGRGRSFKDKDIPGEVSNVMRMLKGFEGKWSKKELAQNQQAIDAEIQGLYPNIPFSFSYVPDALDRPLLFGRNKYIVEGTSWVVAPRMRVIDVVDETGTPGRVHVDEKDRPHDKSKTPIAGVDRAEAGDVLPGVTFKRSYQPRTAGQEAEHIAQSYRKIVERLGTALESRLAQHRANWEEAKKTEPGLTWDQFVAGGYR